MKKQRQKKLTADTSSSEAEAKNEPRQKIIAATVYNFPFSAAQIQPIISIIQPNVPYYTWRKLQAEKQYDEVT
ncbi:hypothetical protein FLA4_11790 [Candidatus Rickettsia kotlanii]|nr:hypothetical protein FLA4_11790 [Candidatus Rickettsia kotlanii]BDU62011.1 hypothetical protein HM2_11790 [Candidatus Rickettsia kotlanii]